MIAPQKEKAGGRPGDFETTTNETNHSAIADDSKAFSTLQARFAMAGHALYRTTAPDGSVGYLATRWGLVRALNTLEDCEKFLIQIRGQK